MNGDQRGDGDPGKVVSIEAFRKKMGPTLIRRRARLFIAEDASGDMDYGLEGINALNSLSLLVPLLHLSSRLLDVYLGKP